MKKVLLILLILALAAYGALIFSRGGSEYICYLRGGLYPFARITGIVALREADGQIREESFSAGGDYGRFEFPLDFGETEVVIDLFNRASWHIIDMRFDIGRDADGIWLATGTIAVDGFLEMEYEKHFDPDQAIEIKVDCFP